MRRITDAFNRLQAEHRKGFIPFITAGDPDLKTTRELLVGLARAGATVIELGVPFSDPMADGPVIQRASERALRNGVTIQDIFEVVADARPDMNGVPVVLFSYFNPLLQFGLMRLCTEAKNAGVDGFLVTDLIPEESADFARLLHEHELDMIFLVAPTSTDVRLKMVAERASGFIYAVSRAGVTGAQREISLQAEHLVARMREFSTLPVAVGFGISTAEQVAGTWQYADAAVVGSAIVAEIESAQQHPETIDLVGQVGAFCRNLLPR